ncbi:MAG: hypothetical protein PHQ27_05910, partial [Victivallales bacterium]|nr:hypothetical protein [Victivallales bacterium]
MSRRKKIFWLVPLLLVAVLLAALAFGYRRYRQDVRADTPIEQSGPITVTPATGGIGVPRTVAVRFKGPWHRRPVEAAVTPVKGLIPDGTPSIHRVGFGFGYAVWEIRAEFKPFRTGNLAGTTMRVMFNRPEEGSRITAVDLQLPAIEVTPLDSSDPKLVSA